MTKLYKTVPHAVVILLVVLLMHFARTGAMHAVHVLSLSLLFGVGLVIGAITSQLEAE